MPYQLAIQTRAPVRGIDHHQMKRRRPGPTSLVKSGKSQNGYTIIVASLWLLAW
jgi:hypothetical protein